MGLAAYTYVHVHTAEPMSRVTLTEAEQTSLTKSEAVLRAPLEEGSVAKDAGVYVRESATEPNSCTVSLCQPIAHVRMRGFAVFYPESTARLDAWCVTLLDVLTWRLGD